MLKQCSHKIIQCIAVCSIDQKLQPFKNIPCTSYHYRQLEQKYITSLEFVTQKNHSYSKQKYLEIHTNLYLKLNFSEESKPHVTQIQFFQAKNDIQALKIKPMNWIPVTINQERRKQKQSHFYKQRRINVYPFLNEKKIQEKSLILCYKVESNQTYHKNCLSDIQIIVSQKKQSTFKLFKKQQPLKLPQSYKIINYPLVCKNILKYLIFKQAKNKLEYGYKPRLLQNYPGVLTNKDISLNSIQCFCFPEGVHFTEDSKGFQTFNFILTIESGQRIYGHCLIFKQEADISLVKKLELPRMKLYCQKAICILSEFSYTDEFTKLLCHLYRISVSKNQIPFYKVIQNLESIKLVEKQNLGKIATKYNYGGCKIFFSTNTQYPNVSQKSIFCLFKFLQIQNIMTIFRAILMEKKIFFISQSKPILSLIIQAFVSFLFPFKWQHVLIPILPIIFTDYIQAPVPFIIGLTYTSDIEFGKQCIIIYLDKNQIINQQQIPPFPYKLQKQLQKRLSQYKNIYNDKHIKQIIANSQNNINFQIQNKMIEATNIDIYDIRDAFLQFHINFMKNYQKFWIKQPINSRQKTRMQSIIQTTALESLLFNTQQFLNDMGMNKIGSFGYKFTQSLMFTGFIQTRSSQQQNSYLYFFDNCIQIIKKSKKDRKFIIQKKIDWFRSVPEPIWQIKKQVYFQYKCFPSICTHQNFSLKTKDIQLMSTATSKQLEYEQQISEIKFMLNQKCDIYQGILHNEDMKLNDLEELNLSEDILRYMRCFVIGSRRNNLIKQIKQQIELSSSYEELKTQLIILHMINKELKFLQKSLCEVTSQTKIKRQKDKQQQEQIMIDTLVNSRIEYEFRNDKVIGYHNLYEFHTIIYADVIVLFYESQLKNKQECRKIKINIHSKLLKQIVNTMLKYKLKRLTQFFIDLGKQYNKIQQKAIKLKLSFQDLLKFKYLQT